MEKVKCECGKINPQGTILCGFCGKPTEDTSTSLVDMRYEGSARRSQTYNKTVIDKIWNFFSSVKVGIWIIVLTLIASAFGTIFPQEMYIPPNVSPSVHYEEQYGLAGELYYELGFHNLYGSWWYMVLIFSLGISLIVASLDRVVPLYRTLKHQGIKKHSNFFKRQRIFGITTVSDGQTFEKVKSELIKRRYNVREEDGNILAEKGRFSRWGPYVNHIGLIIFLFGAMLRFFPGFYIDEVVWVREGETKVIPGTNQTLYIKNEEFIKDLYDESDTQFEVGMGLPKNYQTNAVLYERQGSLIPGATLDLEKIKEYPIRVNLPLKHEGFALYQVDYKENELSEMSFRLMNKETGDKYGELTVSLAEPKSLYDLGNGAQVELMNYFPDFYFNTSGEPDTKTKIPNNPAFVFKMTTEETPEGEISFVGIKTNLEPFGENKYKMSFTGIETRDVSGLVVRKDLTLPIIAVGGFIFMVGVVQGMYWNHRRIWLQRNDKEIWVAAHTNKNWFALKKDILSAIKDTEIEPPQDQMEEAERQETLSVH